MGENFFRRSRFELLENRELLAGDFQVSSPIADVRQLAAMFAPEQVSEIELRNQLASKGLQIRPEDNLADLRSAQKEYYGVENDSIFVSVMGSGTSEDLLPLLEAAQFSVEFASTDLPVVDGYIPLSQLRLIVENPLVTAIIPVNREHLTNSVGTVTNEAENVLRGATLTGFRGLSGAGVNIGVISNGVAGLSSSQSTGNLPPNAGTPGATVTIDVLNAGSGAEGTAMLELIHDIAPGSDLLFHGAGISEASFASAVQNLVNAGADIIVDDINGLGTESWFADGVAAAAINSAVATGVTYFSSAGNRGDNGYESVSRFVSSQNVLGNIGTFHDFSGTGDFLQTVTITSDAPSGLPDFHLQFDQLFGAVTSNVRLWVFSAAGAFITSSTQANNLLGDPNDFISNLTGTGTVQLAIELVSGPVPNRVHWLHWGDVGFIEHDLVSGALRTARNPGHAAAVNNISVGTTDVANPLVRRSYSGIGHATRSLTPAGAPMTLELRGGPTLMGVDGTNTSVNVGGENFLTFFGTSAAAPNVAATAALLLQADPSLTPDDLRSLLVDGARDIDAAGIDLTSGAGVVDALGSLGTLENIPQLLDLADNQFILINVTNDALDTNPDPNIIDVNAGTPGNQVSLRAAVVNANLSTGTQRTILLPQGNYNLTLASTGGDTQEDGDLDLNRHMIIIGSGAGATIIDGSTLTTRDRIFETLGTGSLDLWRVTLTGGQTSDRGGAIRLNNNTTPGVRELTLRDVAIVGNTATNAASNGFGGGVYVAPGASAFVIRSVITNNTAGANNGGGGIFAAGNMSVGSTVLLDKSIVAKNTSANGLGNDLRSTGMVAGKFTSNGGNMLTSTTGATFGTPGLQPTDYVNPTVHYVVTSVVDSFNHSDDAYALSTREAIDMANDFSGQTIWLPAWNFTLTRQRTAATNAVEMDISQGDLEIMESLVIRGSGISGATSVKWKPGVVDKVFELLGDYNGDGIASGEVDSADYSVWRDTLGSTTDLRADGDDNGTVDQADWDVWNDHFGNTLTRTNVSVS